MRQFSIITLLNLASAVFFTSPTTYAKGMPSYEGYWLNTISCATNEKHIVADCDFDGLAEMFQVTEQQVLDFNGNVICQRNADKTLTCGEEVFTIAEISNDEIVAASEYEDIHLTRTTEDDYKNKKAFIESEIARAKEIIKNTAGHKLILEKQITRYEDIVSGEFSEYEDAADELSDKDEEKDDDGNVTINYFPKNLAFDDKAVKINDEFNTYFNFSTDTNSANISMLTTSYNGVPIDESAKDMGTVYFENGRILFKFVSHSKYIDSEGQIQSDITDTTTLIYNIEE